MKHVLNKWFMTQSLTTGKQCTLCTHLHTHTHYNSAPNLRLANNTQQLGGEGREPLTLDERAQSALLGDHQFPLGRYSRQVLCQTSTHKYSNKTFQIFLSNPLLWVGLSGHQCQNFCLLCLSFPEECYKILHES